MIAEQWRKLGLRIRNHFFRDPRRFRFLPEASRCSPKIDRGVRVKCLGTRGRKDMFAYRRPDSFLCTMAIDDDSWADERATGWDGERSNWVVLHGVYLDGMIPRDVLWLPRFGLIFVCWNCSGYWGAGFVSFFVL